jgi:hypothetical protein
MGRCSDSEMTDNLHRWLQKYYLTASLNYLPHISVTWTDLAFETSPVMVDEMDHDEKIGE